MKKQKKIKEAYLVLFNNEQPEERFKSIERYISENGWFSGELYEVSKSLLDESGDECRPISLRGIENNNGWIKIKSESDLPKDIEDDATFWVINDGEMEYALYMQDSQRWYDSVNLNLRIYPSHYQPIIKPEPPLY